MYEAWGSRPAVLRGMGELRPVGTQVANEAELGGDDGVEGVRGKAGSRLLGCLSKSDHGQEKTRGF